MKNPNVLNEYKSNEMYKMKFWKKTPSFFFDVPVSVKKKREHSYFNHASFSSSSWSCCPSTNLSNSSRVVFSYSSNSSGPGT